MNNHKILEWHARSRVVREIELTMHDDKDNPQSYAISKSFSAWCAAHILRWHAAQNHLYGVVGVGEGDTFIARMFGMFHGVNSIVIKNLGALLYHVYRYKPFSVYSNTCEFNLKLPRKAPCRVQHIFLSIILGADRRCWRISSLLLSQKATHTQPNSQTRSCSKMLSNPQ